ncbi:MAG: glycosyl transferase [Lentisphaerae bacterium]|nr:glycosyl transferase [Lentisphaerota bacterium]
MKYGQFDATKKEYVIQTPNTPLPWINYLGTQEFFGMISNSGGGYCFMIDARKQRLTRYRYNNVPMDSGGRYLYIKDDQTGKMWAPGWMPVKADLDVYECRHGLGYTVITGEKDAIRVSTRYFVPFNESCEIWETDITNTGKRKKSFTLFSFVEFCGWEALNDATNLQRTLNLGEVEVDGSVIYHLTEYRERRNHFAYFAASEKIAGYDTDSESFLGRYNGFHEPRVVAEGKSRNSVACGWNPCGSHSIRITLKPGETRKMNFMLGYAQNPENEKFSAPGVLNKKRVRVTLKKYLNRKNSEKAFENVVKQWEELTGRFQVETPYKNLDMMVNTWNQYQCVTTYNMARSTSYYETGIGRGIGYRDACQDLYGAVHIMPPERSRTRILELAAIQWRNGATYHQYQQLDKKGNATIGVGFNDDPLWLILGTATYIKETGDWSILEEQAQFDNNPKDTATLYEHLIISVKHIMEHRGPHKLPLVGRADWNDCLNLIMTSIKPGDTFQGDATHASLKDKIGSVPESLMIAGQFVWAVGEFMRMAQHKKDRKNEKMAAAAVKEMQAAIIKHGWDGEWFVRAFDRFGKKVGSRENPEGKIFAESHGWIGMASVGKENGMLEKALDSVKERLFSRHGIVLQQPAYTKYNFYLGEMTSYPPGVKENGGIFCQPTGWLTISECNVGRGDQAMEYYKSICPAERESISDVHRCEPYVYAQMIAGPDSARFGEAKNSWLTGTAASSFLAVSQYILGIKPEYDGLLIDPCIPKGWKGFRVHRKFRNATYEINVVNPSHVSKGVKSVTVDGKTLAGCILPDFKDGKHHKVEVVMG